MRSGHEGQEDGPLHEGIIGTALADLPQTLLLLGADWVWQTDADLRLTRVDGGPDATYGVAATELRGHARHELADIRDDPKTWAAHLRDLGLRKPFRDFHSVVGGRRIVESGAPRFGEDGRFLGYVGTGRDITTTANAQRELDTAHEILREAIEAMDDGFLLFDDADRLILSNSKYLGRFPLLAHSTIVGTPYATAMTREASALANSVLPSDHMNIREYRSRTGGRVRIYHDVSELKRHEQQLADRVAELQSIRSRLEQQSDDLKELARSLAEARDEAERASRAKSEFVATVSHELRTPLNAIIGFSEIIRDEALGTVGDRRYVDYSVEIVKGGRKLLNLINRLLELSKADAGMLELVYEPVEAGNLIEAALADFEEELAQRKIALTVVVPPNLPRLDVDGRRVRQAMGNLIQNALDFTHDNGHIRVEAYRRDDQLILAVADDGAGMAPEQLPVALERFGRIDGALDRRHGGIGLGLPLTRALIELHGGTLELESALGQGTVVRCRFPAARLID
ncbi:ATP-binding protein [Zavarzinia sp. CC-PAN008]|uniref:sensor histidine kinase n=1 Tax=Zavarzinia sp. CC-PAN008 TaxID=3243332 RepID=UPI003F7439A6